MLRGEIFSAAELSEIGTLMDLALKEANTQAEVCIREQSTLMLTLTNSKLSYRSAYLVSYKVILTATSNVVYGQMSVEPV